MAEHDRPIWELDFSLQDLNVSALSHKRDNWPIITEVRLVPEADGCILEDPWS
jgi:hypothetical protein